MAQQWFDREAFWQRNYDRFFTESRLEQGQAEVENLCVLTGVPGGAALDLCCGPGRHAVALARKGFTVTGVDLTALHLKKARELAAQKQAAVEWVEADMRHFFRHRAYDLAVNLFTSFGYFDKPSDNNQVLDNLFYSLKPGGALVMDVMGRERLAKIWQPASVEEFDDGTKVLQHRSVTDDWTRVENEHFWVKDDALLGVERFSHFVYSGAELKLLLLQAGFESVDLYGSLSGDSYGPDASRLVAVARKGQD